MSLSPSMEAALEAPCLLMFCAVKLVYPAFTLRLLDGAGVLTINGEGYTGKSDTYGVLAGVETLTDGVDSDAPRVRLVLNPPTMAALAGLADPLGQGGTVEIWEGLVNQATGLVVPDPDLVFVGELDQAVYSPKSLAVTVDCVSALERFFDQDEGVRLTDSWHQSVWPGELGLSYVTSVKRQLPWGQDAPRPSVISYTSGPFDAGGGLIAGRYYPE